MTWPTEKDLATLSGAVSMLSVLADLETLDAWSLDNGFRWSMQGRTCTLETFLEGSDEPVGFTGKNPNEGRSMAAKAIKDGKI